MATKVGHLRIILSANAGRFTKAMDRAHKRVSEFSRSATKFAFRVGGIGTALAGLMAGGGFVTLIANAFNTVDALAKTSDKLGIATEKLAALRLAADLSGVGISKMEMGLQRMVRRVSEAAVGTGEAQAAIRELGLDAKRLNQLAPDEMFVSISKALAKIPNQADRIRIAFKIWDSEGVALVNTASLINAEWDEIQKKTRQFGTAVTRIDAAKLEIVKDSLRLIREWISGAAQQIAINLAPFLNDLSNRLLDVAEDGEEMGITVKKAFEKMVRGAVAFGIALREQVEITPLESKKSWYESMGKAFGTGPGRKARGPLGIVVSYAIGDLLGYGTPALNKKFDEIEDEIADIRMGSDEYLNKYLRMLDAVNSSMDKALERYRNFRAGQFAEIESPLARATGTIQGRLAQEGLIRSGGILGVQKMAAEAYAKNTAQNTKDTAIGIGELLRMWRTTGMPIHLGA